MQQQHQQQHQQKQTIAQRQADENQRLMGRNVPYIAPIKLENLAPLETRYKRFPQPPNSLVPNAVPLSALGFNVSAETDLWNVHRKLSCNPRDTYFPRASSDLYLETRINGPPVGDTLLFEQPVFCKHAGSFNNTSMAIFNNNTRIQVKDAANNKPI